MSAIYYVDPEGWKDKPEEKNREALKQVEEALKGIEVFSDALGVKISYGVLDLFDVIRAYSRDVSKLIKIDGFQPNACKQAGYFAFWIRKLKPLFEVTKDEKADTVISDDKLRILQNFLNEVFAIYIAYAIILGSLENDVYGDSEELLHEQILSNHQLSQFRYDLRYRSISPYMLSAYLEMFIKGNYPAIS
jgi:hypothetical protein